MPPELDNTETADELSLRDALSAAFDEASEAETPADDAAGETAQGETAEDGQPRDEQGRWTKAQREHFEAQQREEQAAKDAAQQGQQEQQQEGQEPLRLAPPHGWSPAAKAAYAKLPPEVQEAVARREVEINNGFAKLKDYKGLDEYAEMAKASGTTLREAFDRYKAAEDLLDRDFRGGVMQLCEMYGVHPMQLAQEFAALFQGQGGQPQPGQPPGAQPGADPQVALLSRELAGIKDFVRTLTTREEQREREGINTFVQQFAQDKLYFEDVRQDMAHLIRTGQANDLNDAYDKACWMNPQIRDLLIKERAAPQEAEARVSKARRASGSLPTGAPAGTTSPSSAHSIRAALEDAWGSGAL
jgi:hypothetical protein